MEKFLKIITDDSISLLEKIDEIEHILFWLKSQWFKIEVLHRDNAITSCYRDFWGELQVTRKWIWKMVEEYNGLNRKKYNLLKKHLYEESKRKAEYMPLENAFKQCPPILISKNKRNEESKPKTEPIKPPYIVARGEGYVIVYDEEESKKTKPEIEHSKPKRKLSWDEWHMILLGVSMLIVISLLILFNIYAANCWDLI